MERSETDSRLSVREFMLIHARRHSDMTYDESRMGFLLDKCYDISTGIYFIVRKDTKEIQKIGKAEGKYGLKGRIATYRGKLASRKNDKTVEIYKKAMTGVLAGVPLEMHILPLPTKTMDYLGIEVELQMARSLELTLSKRARDEGHGMHLSGQD